MSPLLHELWRKAFHVLGSLIPIGYYFVSKETALVVLLILNAVLLFVEWMRIKGKINIPKTLLRPHEEKCIAAYIYFQIGALISLLVFDKTVAIAALLMLALGDTASGLAGAVIKGGDYRNVVKPLPVIAVMFSVCMLIGFALMNLPGAPDMTSLSLAAYIAGAIGATLGDAVPIRIKGKPIDDNLMIPLLAGVFMTAACLV